jgi:primosomal protein N'
VRNLGLVIVDEEHDPGYKQTDGNTIKAATWHARQAVGPARWLGSATPSMESCCRSGSGTRWLRPRGSKRARRRRAPHRSAGTWPPRRAAVADLGAALAANLPPAGRVCCFQPPWLRASSSVAPAAIR